MSKADRAIFKLPEWVPDEVQAWSEYLDTDEAKVEFAGALAFRNVLEGTGGPFGAIVIDRPTGKLLGVGLDVVERYQLVVARAEVVALSLTAVASKCQKLPVECELIVSCAPSPIGVYTIIASGIGSIITSASAETAALAGFDHDDLKSPWDEILKNFGLEVKSNFEVETGKAAIEEWKRKGRFGYLK